MKLLRSLQEMLFDKLLGPGNMHHLSRLAESCGTEMQVLGESPDLFGGYALLIKEPQIWSCVGVTRQIPEATE